MLWAPPSLEYKLWCNYLDVFDCVKLMARARSVESPPAGWQQASGEGIQLVPLPYFVGPANFARAFLSLRQSISTALATAEAIVLRVPCWIGGLAWRCLRAGRPYGLEVVGDPHDVFAPGAVRHPARPLFRLFFARELRHQCASATSVSYVTATALQRRYPASPASFTTHFTSTGLRDEDFIDQPRRARRDRSEFTLVLVGTLEWPYKGVDVLIEALSVCIDHGMNIRAVIVGDGKHRRDFERLATRLGLDQRMRFLGELPSGDSVRSQLDAADLFVLPSRADGLPRAMLEAMARAVPCIGSTVGGIPELLSSEDMVPPGDARALASKICSVLLDPDRIEAMSRRNLILAREYHRERLRERRRMSYRYLQKATEVWLKAR